MRESTILTHVLLALSQAFHPGVFWRQNAGKVQTATGHWIELGPDGIADVVGFIPTPHGARIIFIETKTRKGKQRESQKRFQSAVEAAGAIYVIARSGAEAVTRVKERLKSPSPSSPLLSSSLQDTH